MRVRKRCCWWDWVLVVNVVVMGLFAWGEVGCVYAKHRDRVT